MYRVESQFARSNAVRLGLIHVRRLYSNRTKSNRLSTHIAPSAHGPIQNHTDYYNEKIIDFSGSRACAQDTPARYYLQNSYYVVQQSQHWTVRVKAHTTSIITQALVVSQTASRPPAPFVSVSTLRGHEAGSSMPPCTPSLWTSSRGNACLRRNASWHSRLLDMHGEDSSAHRVRCQALQGLCTASLPRSALESPKSSSSSARGCSSQKGVASPARVPALRHIPMPLLDGSACIPKATRPPPQTMPLRASAT